MRDWSLHYKIKSSSNKKVTQNKTTIYEDSHLISRSVVDGSAGGVVRPDGRMYILVKLGVSLVTLIFI